MAYGTDDFGYSARTLKGRTDNKDALHIRWKLKIWVILLGKVDSRDCAMQLFFVLG